MKNIVMYSQACAYLEKIYDTLNREKYNGELETPILTIQSSEKTYGHVTTAKVWKCTDKNQYELNISAEALNRPIENVVATLLHEMTHIYCMMHGIQDTSRNGQYHNKRFKAQAETVGLIIEKDNKIGWSLTRPSEELVKYIHSKKWDMIPLFRSSPHDSKTTGGKRPSSTRKYICPCCEQSVRATKKTILICGYCKIRMESENPDDNDIEQDQEEEEGT